MKRTCIYLLTLVITIGVINAAPATAQWIDVLSYVRPCGGNCSFSVITNYGNPWRTFDKAVGERLPSFFITKGGLDYSTYKAWNFEQMIYDGSWIYLVRDTSWTAHCSDNGHIAGMLLFTYENGQWLRGGRHFPRWIYNGSQVDTGSKYVQGVERKEGTWDTGAQEGRWCSTPYSGWTSSTVRGDLVGGMWVGNRYFSDVLKLEIVAGAGTGDKWWFAKNTGFIKFTDGSITEYHDFTQDPYEVDVRIPCEPNPPCM